MSIAKEILFDELIEQSHPNLVERVIYEALCDYYKKREETFNGAIAYSICKRIDDAVENKNYIIQNHEKIKFLKQ